jgi:5-methylcytosine-specific restriction endonuclease McrA
MSQNVFLIPANITKQWYAGTYLKTNHWKWRRRHYLESVEHRCERCGLDWATEIHHLSYERLYAEPDADLIALCRPCHIHMHFKPANDNQLTFLFDTLDKKSSGDKTG